MILFVFFFYYVKSFISIFCLFLKFVLEKVFFVCLIFSHLPISNLRYLLSDLWECFLISFLRKFVSFLLVPCENCFVVPFCWKSWNDTWFCLTPSWKEISKYIKIYYCNQFLKKISKNCQCEKMWFRKSFLKFAITSCHIQEGLRTAG